MEFSESDYFLILLLLHFKKNSKSL